MVWVIWSRAVGVTSKPPPEQDENPRKLMNDCCPLASRYTLPLADDKTSVYAELNFVGAPEDVMQIPFDEYADVIE